MPSFLSLSTTACGTVILVILSQDENMLLPISVRDAGSATSVNAVQPEKADVPKLFYSFCNIQIN